jgi:MFS family permease
MGLAPGLATFSVGMIVYGLSWCISSPLYSYATDARGRWPVGRTLAFVSATYNLGLAVGPAIGGWLGEMLGLQKIFLVGAACIGVGALLIWFIPPQPVVRSAAGKRPGLSALQPRFLLYLALVLFGAFAAYLPQPLSQNFLNSYRGLPLPVIGRITSLAGFGTVVLSLGLGLLEVHPAFLLSQAAVAMFPLLMWQGTGVGWYALGYFLLGGFKTFRSMACAQSGSAVPPADMGLAYGLTEAVAAVALILAPPAAGLLYMKNPALVYGISFALVLVSITAGAFFSPRTLSRAGEGQEALARQS